MVFDKAERLKRFELHTRLTEAEKSEVMGMVEDSYKTLGALEGVKAYDWQGEPIYGYLPHQYDYMVKSAITGQKIRYYIELEDEYYVHPSELFPNMVNSQIKKDMINRKYHEREAEERYQKSIELLKKHGELEAVAASLKKALANGLEIDYYYSSSDRFKIDPFCRLKGVSLMDNTKHRYLTIVKYHLIVTNKQTENNTYYGLSFQDMISYNAGERDTFVNWNCQEPNLLRFYNEYCQQ